MCIDIFGHYMAIGDETGYISIWDLTKTTEEPDRKLRAHWHTIETINHVTHEREELEQALTCGWVSLSDNTIATATDFRPAPFGCRGRKEVKVWDQANCRCLHKLERVEAQCAYQGSLYTATHIEAGFQIQLWMRIGDAVTLLKTFKIDVGQRHLVQIFREGATFGAVIADSIKVNPSTHVIKVWDINTGKQCGSIPNPKDYDQIVRVRSMSSGLIIQYYRSLGLLCRKYYI